MKLSTIRPLVAEGEAVENHGEDSYFVRTSDSGLFFMGVFDGCGGLGGRRYTGLNKRTGAWIGSQAAAYAADAFVKRGGFDFTLERAKLLQRYIGKKLSDYKNKLEVSVGVQVGGKLKKSLPTTVCMAAARQDDSDINLCEFLWAGDSRGYILDDEGLCQMTTDDIDSNEDDAFRNLREDGVLTNVAHGDGDFVLHSGTRYVSRPSVLICATDGCFAYFLSPMDFEFVVLDTIISADSTEEWLELLGKRIKEVTGDDYAITISCLGFGSFDEMKNYFSARRDQVETLIKMQENASEEQLKILWDQYKPTYYRYTLNMEY